MWSLYNAVAQASFKRVSPAARRRGLQAAELGLRGLGQLSTAGKKGGLSMAKYWADIRPAPGTNPERPKGGGIAAYVFLLLLVLLLIWSCS